MKNRVVVTGLGVLAPNGIGVEAFWKSLVAAESAIDHITLFDASRLSSQIAGEIRNFNPSNHIRWKIKPKRTARHAQLALAAVQMALDDASWTFSADEQSDPIPLVLGVSTSAFDIIMASMNLMTKHGPSHATPYVASSSPPQAMTSFVSENLGIPTQNLTISSACTAGLDAIGASYEIIRSGKSDLAITGGADAPISLMPFANLTAAGLSSTHNQDPKRASRPFDLERDAGVISEGAGALILESLDHALARGARPYLEIKGYGTQNDLDASEPACGFEQSMNMALANAGRRTADVDYICAHGPGHPVLDRIETQTIKKVFGNRAHSIPVSSIKGVTGNPLAAAGPLQVIATALAMKFKEIPPTANCRTPDPSCDLDYVSEGSRKSRIRCVMINSHGIGGGNSSLLVENFSLQNESFS